MIKSCMKVDMRTIENNREKSTNVKNLNSRLFIRCQIGQGQPLLQGIQFHPDRNLGTKVHQQVRVEVELGHPTLLQELILQVMRQIEHLMNIMPDIKVTTLWDLHIQVGTHMPSYS